MGKCLIAKIDSNIVLNGLIVVIDCLRKVRFQVDWQKFF